MNEEKKIVKAELQEMARVILSEIYGAGKFRSGQNEPDYLEAFGRTASLTEDGFGEPERRAFGFDDEVAIRRKQGSFGEQTGFLPRLNREEFFEQRIKRRRQRQTPNGGFENQAALADRQSIEVSDNLAALNLTEKLSDDFCRDARRYDGAFERY